MTNRLRKFVSVVALFAAQTTFYWYGLGGDMRAAKWPRAIYALWEKGMLPGFEYVLPTVAGGAHERFGDWRDPAIISMGGAACWTLVIVAFVAAGLLLVRKLGSRAEQQHVH